MLGIFGNLPEEGFPEMYGLGCGLGGTVFFQKPAVMLLNDIVCIRILLQVGSTPATGSGVGGGSDASAFEFQGDGAEIQNQSIAIANMYKAGHCAAQCGRGAEVH